jgi:hypothetical protein
MLGPPRCYAVSAKPGTHSSVIFMTSYTYDAARRLSSITYPSGAIMSYAGDPMRRLIGISLQPRDATASLAVASGVADESE